MKVVQVKEVKYSKDVYKLEVSEGSLGQKMYSLYINNKYDRNYMRLPKDLREFFSL